MRRFQIERLHPTSASCGRTTAGVEERCVCGRELPLAVVVPYGSTWDFDSDLVEQLGKTRAARLGGRFVGKDLRQISRFAQLEFLHLSRCPKFDFSMLAALPKLAWLELDFMNLETLSGIERLASLESLKFIECRRLRDIRAIRRVPRLRVFEDGLCSRLSSLTGLSGCRSLVSVRHLSKSLESLEFARGLRKLRYLAVNGAIEKPSLEPLMDGSLCRLFVRRRAVSKSELLKFRARNPSCEVVFAR